MKRTIAAWAALICSTAAMAQVTVQDPWVRATVPQQQATGAFMRLTSATPARLLAASSPAAKVVEIHEMVMEGDVMKMRALPGLDLPAGKAVELKPGGYHVMLIDLKGQIRDGDTVPVTLTIQNREGQRETITVQAPARGLGATPAAGPAAHSHKH